VWLPKHHAMKTYWGSGSTVPRILNLGTNGGERSASNPGVRSSDDNWIVRWVGSRVGLNAVAKKNSMITPIGI